MNEHWQSQQIAWLIMNIYWTKWLIWTKQNTTQYTNAFRKFLTRPPTIIIIWCICMALHLKWKKILVNSCLFPHHFKSFVLLAQSLCIRSTISCQEGRSIGFNLQQSHIKLKTLSGHFSGCDGWAPSLSRSMNKSIGTSLNGLSPMVMISHKRMPKDQTSLWGV